LIGHRVQNLVKPGIVAAKQYVVNQVKSRFELGAILIAKLFEVANVVTDGTLAREVALRMFITTALIV